MEYNNRVICGIFHVRTNFYENLEYVFRKLDFPFKGSNIICQKFRLQVTTDDNINNRDGMTQLIFFLSATSKYIKATMRKGSIRKYKQFNSYIRKFSRGPN